MREIGDIVLGTRESGITPEFARVLRTQILEKDRQRLFLAPGAAASPALDDGASITATVEIEAP